MTNPPIVSELRQRMLEDMASRQLARGTQIGHIRACKRFAVWLKRSQTSRRRKPLARSRH